MRSIPLWWALPVGLVSVVWQATAYFIRFGQFNPYATFRDYVWFFIGGTLGGLILVMFMNRQPAEKGRWAVLIAFVLATPVAMIFMVGGGLFGLVSVLIFPQIPWLIFTWIGFLVGGYISRGRYAK